MSRSGILTGRSDRSIAHFEARKRILAAGYGPLAAHGGLRITAVTLTVSILSAHQVGRIDFDALGRGVAHTRSGASDNPLKRGMGAWGAPKDFLNVAERSVHVRAELALWGAKCGKTAILTHVRRDDVEYQHTPDIVPARRRIRVGSIGLRATTAQTVRDQCGKVAGCLKES